MRIPLSLLPPSVLMSLSKHAEGMGEFISSLLPNLRLELMQAEVDMPPRRYAAVSLVSATVNFILISFITIAAGFLTRRDVVLLGIFAGLLVWIASFFTILFYPAVIARRRTRNLEANLIPALRQLLINIKSGVPLFQAMASVSSGYGPVSREFAKMVEQMNAGVAQTDVLNEASKRNPSFRFRRVLWQISNALKVGSDVGRAIEGMIDELTRERIAEIQRYGQELNPWVMIYMVMAVVLPSLGITMIIIIMSFMNVLIPITIFPAVFLFLLVFQLFFISFVKSRRPQVD
ncbi:type II secretion system F family protein [Candidatus Micrarchaeota archaeon]|nr:type II secretion system F family protein [Candidatus Micrarchaeota archaeon]